MPASGENRLTDRRARRRRCTWPDNSAATSCEYCASRHLRCVQEPPEGGYYHKRQARLQESGHGEQALSPTQSASLSFTGPHVELPPMPLRLELASLYFDYIHDQFHSLFHRPSFMADVASDRVAPVVLLAIFALSARYGCTTLLCIILEPQSDQRQGSHHTKPWRVWTLATEARPSG